MITVVDQAQPLVDPQQHVGENNPVPTRGKHHKEWDRQANQPATNENPLATDLVAHCAGEQVCERFDHTEGDNEGQNRGA